MKARDVMVSPVITAKPNALVRDVAKLFLEKRISAVPVVDDQGKIVGIVSEGDLIRRVETDTGRQRSWWLRLLAGEETQAAEYVKAHAKKAGDVMTAHVITARPDTPLHEIAALMEKHAIKRVPIVADGKLAGIVSRANLVQAVASAPMELKIAPSDESIRERLMAHLERQPWAHTHQLNVTVNNGVVDIWGVTFSESERDAIRVAAENIPGVRAVSSRLFIPPPSVPAY
jgi:CBS-domain-containing membrane protein